MVSINSGTTGSVGARTLASTNATLALGNFGYQPFWVCIHITIELVDMS